MDIRLNYYNLEGGEIHVHTTSPQGAYKIRISGNYVAGKAVEEEFISSWNANCWTHSHQLTVL